MIPHSDIGAVVIGRNEGDRLIRCLASLQGQIGSIVYVDSGSSDGSLAAARAAGASVLELDADQPFTAARARNAGLAALVAAAPELTYVQFLDGDCELQPDWVSAARAFLDTTPEAVVACGRRRERHPEASIYNRLIDAEWDTPIGLARACGGDALMRIGAVLAVGGFNPSLIAGEEPELCVRLRGAGGTVHRLNAEMTLHDAAMTRFGQWWQRNRRAGHAYAEGVALHGASPEYHNKIETMRAVLWGLVLPLTTLVGFIISPWALSLLALWPTQVVRLRFRGLDWSRAVFLTLGKLPEAQGVVGYLWRRWRRQWAALIEYK